MALKEQINNDLKAALLGGNRFAGEVLRGLKAAILNEEVAKGKRDEGLNDDTIEQLIVREVKKRNESAIIYDGADRPELAENERKEAEVLAAYLPQQLSEAEIQAVVTRIVTELGASDPSVMGQVIGAVKKELGSSADGATIAKLVKNTLH
ncbi:MAG TPA: GatB/YqeY domain-containing protein [Candidatus Saccharimonadales bacterium]|nr:GatB/YqeY domain-containing protein [Candidatus Saccharimonadales bacterium]